MSDAFVQQLPTLAGVAVGALAAYVTTSLADRTRLRRERDERWDIARMQAYAEFSNAVKRVFDLATRMSAGRGIAHPVEPVSPDEEATRTLTEAKGERGRTWEAVLLLGDTETVDAARAWWHEVWRFVWFARCWLTGHEEWSAALRESDAAREKFYESARKDLRVSGQVRALDPAEPPWQKGRSAVTPIADDLST